MTKVTFAYPYTDENGKDFKPDQSADVDDEVARLLVQDGKARLAETTAKPSNSKES